MPGSTQFPAALDAFPDIGPNTDEAAAGAEHDVVHANVHAAVAALQAKVGVDASADGASLDARLAAAEGAGGDLQAHAADPGAHAAGPATIEVAAGVAVMDCAGGVRFFSLALGVSATLSIINAPAADCLILRVVPSGGAVLTLPASVTALGAAYATGASGPEVLGFMTMDGGAGFDLVYRQP